MAKARTLTQQQKFEIEEHDPTRNIFGVEATSLELMRRRSRAVYDEANEEIEYIPRNWRKMATVASSRNSFVVLNSMSILHSSGMKNLNASRGSRRNRRPSAGGQVFVVYVQSCRV